nr:hypothetical transcript [Hymenolepis microstoma]
MESGQVRSTWLHTGSDETQFISIELFSGYHHHLRADTSPSIKLRALATTGVLAVWFKADIDTVGVSTSSKRPRSNFSSVLFSPCRLLMEFLAIFDGVKVIAAQSRPNNTQIVKIVPFFK